MRESFVICLALYVILLSLTSTFSVSQQRQVTNRPEYRRRTSYATTDDSESSEGSTEEALINISNNSKFKPRRSQNVNVNVRGGRNFEKEKTSSSSSAASSSASPSQESEEPQIGGRNFGSRIRGLNTNSESNANSLGTNSRNHASVIAYNPSNYNRIVKRPKKRPSSNSTSTQRTTTSDFVTSSSVRSTTYISNESLDSESLEESVINESLRVTPSYRENGSTPQSVAAATATKGQFNGFLFHKIPKPILPMNDTDTDPSPSPESFRSRLIKAHNLTETTPADLDLEREIDEFSASSGETNEDSNGSKGLTLSAEGNAPIKNSAIDFEYNPSVTVKNGVFKFQYSDPNQSQQQLHSSKVVHSEDFGISRLNFQHEFKQDPFFDFSDHTTISPYLDEENDESLIETTTEPNLQASEEDGSFSSYRDYFNVKSGENLDKNRTKAGAAKDIVEFLESPSSSEEDINQIKKNLNKTSPAHGVTITVTHFIKPMDNPPLSNLMSNEENAPIPGISREDLKRNLNETTKSTSTTTRKTTTTLKTSTTLRPTPALPSDVIERADRFNKKSQNNQEDSVGTNVLNGENQLQSLKAKVKKNSVNAAAGISIENAEEDSENRGGEVNQNIYEDDEIGVGGIEGNYGSSNNNNNNNNNEDLEIKSAGISPPPPHPQININPTPTVGTKLSKSVFISKGVKPNFTTSTYSFATSSEYNYSFTPGDLNHSQSQEHEHDEDESTGIFDENDQSHHHPQNHNEDQISKPKINKEVTEEDPNKRHENLHPTSTISSSSFWDNLGVSSGKSTQNSVLHKNNNETHKITNKPDLIPESSSSASTPVQKVKVPTTATSSSTSTSTSTSSSKNPTSTTNFSGGGFSVSSSDETSSSSSGETSSISSGAVDFKTSTTMTSEDIPPRVAHFIQVIVDMNGMILCSNFPTFKDMVVNVYEKMGVVEEQIILTSSPECANNSGVEIEEIAKGPMKILKDIMEKKEIGVNKGDNSTLYFYMNNKNGSYDKHLTSDFLGFYELWNISKWIDNDDKPINNFNRKIKKVEMISSIESGHELSNENSGVIAAITIASIAAASLFLLVIILLVMRHRQTKTKFAKRCTPVSLDDYSLDNISVYNSLRRKRSRVSKRSFTNSAYEHPNAPSRLLDAKTLSSLLVENTNLSKLEDEFRRIPNVNPTIEDMPNGAESKNRYANVIPIPDSKVLLTFQDDHPNSDYINANYVRGALGANKSYIITQGPLDETIADFWRMVWEQQVRVIFMLTDFSEAGIPKCAEYYPRSETIDCSQLHGDYQITLEKREISENCIISFLVIKDMERSLRRDIIHLWYVGWPEKGVPKNPLSTIDFLTKSRKFTKESSPILVHCSPGTGRSGTIVAIHMLMQEFDAQQKLDVPKCVGKIRADRAGSVQTKEQYLYIYQVLNVYTSKYSSTNNNNNTGTGNGNGSRIETA